MILSPILPRPMIWGGLGRSAAWSQMIMYPNTPQVCSVNTIILLLPIKWEPPRSQIVNITHLMFMIQAASDQIPAIANESKQTKMGGVTN